MKMRHIFSFRFTVHPSLPYVNAASVRAPFHQDVRIVVIWKPSMRVVCNTELMYKSYWCLEPYCDLNVYMAVRWQMVHIRPPRSRHCYLSICPFVKWRVICRRRNRGELFSWGVTACFTSASVANRMRHMLMKESKERDIASTRLELSWFVTSQP